MFVFLSLAMSSRIYVRCSRRCLSHACVCWTFRHTDKHSISLLLPFSWYYYYYCGCHHLPSHLNVWCVCLYCAIYFPWLMHSFIHSIRNSLSVCLWFFVRFPFSCFVYVPSSERIFLMFCSSAISFHCHFCCRQIYVYRKQSLQKEKERATPASTELLKRERGRTESVMSAAMDFHCGFLSPSLFTARRQEMIAIAQTTRTYRGTP